MTHIEQRRDTAAGWASANPVLHDGEVGFEKNTRKSKLGDGVTAWNSLLYTAAGIAATKADVGLGSVDNTSDADKPISSATAAALLGKAGLASPAFTGNPTAPTAAPGDNDTTLATTAFVQAAITAAITAANLASRPVGHIEFNTTGTNPASYLGGGTWAAWGTGRVPVGVDAVQTEFAAAEQTGGEKTHLLTAAELAAHHHPIGGSTGGESVGHTHTVPGNVRYAGNTATGGSSRRIVAVDEAPSVTGNTIAGYTLTSNGPNVDHTHGLPTNTGDSPAGTGHNNLQPYITCYMFKRTA